ncbi:molybdenum cofactor biosynthesis protein MoaE [Nesterenkonia sp. NBAIMH1]|uniref:molybdenum cofactor biosynthesis protein MoaE n=1 Tax=Nesterenkonia sp. NBAIMH1 TaxID=2600320 RepID=UPI0011B6669D|nr:molybdenum cofactor biosynthesis protein MoaE [Nesterenkonia sp. NBAIMH1]
MSESPERLSREGLQPDQPHEPAEHRLVRTSVTHEALSPAEAEAVALNEKAGAVVVFSGVVRDHDQGHSVRQLTYSSHPTAEERLTEVAAGVAERFPTVRIWVCHRVGPLTVGDHALVAAVASAHRQEAFAACAELVETIKAEVPIWKKQEFESGSSEWVGL